MDDWVRLAGWAEDFVSALYERPFIVRLIVLVLIGKYARRELQGMMDNPVCNYSWYCLENISYNNDGSLRNIFDLVRRKM